MIKHINCILCSVLFSLILLCFAHAQKSEHVVTIDVTQKGQPEFEELLLNGYRTTVSGQVLGYHSSHPDADQALLARANREAHSISW